VACFAWAWCPAPHPTTTQRLFTIRAQAAGLETHTSTFAYGHDSVGDAGEYSSSGLSSSATECGQDRTWDEDGASTAPPLGATAWEWQRQRPQRQRRCTTVHGVLRAPQGDGTEASLLVTPAVLTPPATVSLSQDESSGSGE
jgi:hypothetical protein